MSSGLSTWDAIRFLSESAAERTPLYEIVVRVDRAGTHLTLRMWLTVVHADAPTERRDISRVWSVEHLQAIRDMRVPGIIDAGVERMYAELTEGLT